MERRIIASATARKEWTPVKVRKSELKTVAVVLGDPGRPDIIKPSSAFDSNDMDTIMNLKIALSELKNYRFIYQSNHATLFSDLLKLRGKIDFVMNLCDEGFDNDPRKELHVPAMLEVLKIPYTGSNPQCLTYCYDKSLIRGIAKEMGIPVAEGLYIKPEDNVFEMNIDFPVIIKPNFGDASFAITRESVANDLEELNDGIIRIREKVGYENPVLLEEFLTGKDLTVGIIGNPPDPYTFLPIVEEDYSELPPELPRICGYEAKWITDSPYFQLLKSVPANLPEETEKVIMEHCLRLFERLDCRDYVRFDWRLDQNGIPRLLEVNPNPGWCWDGHLAKMAALKGIGYPEMLLNILQTAEQRINNEIQGVKVEEKKTLAI
jgi:D-alanine-D-alanine ligase